MSLLRPKQIGLSSQGAIIVGGPGPNFNGTNLSLGLTNQIPTSNGVTLVYEFLGRLRDDSGNLISDFTADTAPVNYLNFSNANTGGNPVISSAGSDTDIGLTISTVGTGRVNLTNNLFPNTAAPPFSVLATQGTSGDLQIVTVPALPVVDRVLFYNSTTTTIEWAPISTVFTAFDQINVTIGTGGSFTGTEPLLASTSTDFTLTLIDGLRVISSNTSPQSITIGLSIGSMLTISDPLLDVDTAFDRIAFFDASAGPPALHRSMTFDEFFQLIPGNDFGNDEFVVTTGGSNLTIPSFFNASAAPTIVDDSITVYFNGVALRRTGWTRTGTSLTLVDAVNGYSADTGDVISASYQY